jgi:hypothetical protein
MSESAKESGRYRSGLTCGRAGPDSKGEKVMTRTVLGIAALCLAASGAAAQTYDWSGSTTGADESREYAISPEHVVVLMQSEYADIAMEDAQAPLQGAGGPCFGKASSGAARPRATATASGATRRATSRSAAGR